jgi:hypothetical protein
VVRLDVRCDSSVRLDCAGTRKAIGRKVFTRVKSSEYGYHTERPQELIHKIVLSQSDVLIVRPEHWPTLSGYKVTLVWDAASAISAA